MSRTNPVFYVVFEPSDPEDYFPNTNGVNDLLDIRNTLKGARNLAKEFLEAEQTNVQIWECSGTLLEEFTHKSFIRK